MASAANPKDRTMPDPFDKLLTRFGENAILVVVVMAVCIVMWLGGVL